MELLAHSVFSLVSRIFEVLNLDRSIQEKSIIRLKKYFANTQRCPRKISATVDHEILLYYLFLNMPLTIE